MGYPKYPGISYNKSIIMPPPPNANRKVRIGAATGATNTTTHKGYQKCSVCDTPPPVFVVGVKNILQ